jgi:hypothetical protein
MGRKTRPEIRQESGTKKAVPTGGVHNWDPGFVAGKCAQDLVPKKQRCTKQMKVPESVGSLPA